ncbi:MAG: ABC transporter permease, partial [Gemmatimonadota bacterium]
SPGFTAIAVLSLALGIGANTAIFGLVNAVILRSTPVERPEELVELNLASPDITWAPLSYPEYETLLEMTDEVLVGAAGSMFAVVPHDRGDRVESVTAEMVTGSYFPVLGLRPHLGRLLSEEDHVAPGSHPVVVLSYDYWRSEFAGDPAVVGREIRLSGRVFTVVGVAPEEYEGRVRGLGPSLYLPLYMINEVQPTSFDPLEAAGNHSLFTTARIAPDVSEPELRAAMDRFADEMRSSYPDTWTPRAELGITPVEEIHVNPLVDRVIVPAAGLLLAIVAMVLLIACSNLASFLLARARDRRREIAIRLALGARRGRLVRQLLTESVLLAVTGGAVGVGLAYLLLRVLEGIDTPLAVPVDLDLGMDPTVLLFAFGVSLLAGVVFGLAPALRVTRPDVAGEIKRENTGGPRRRVALRDALVVGQVAVSLLLLVTAGLFLRSLHARQAVDPGFGHEPAAIVTFTVPADRYDEARTRRLVEQIEREVEARPAVETVGVISDLHLNPLSFNSTLIRVDGMEPPPGESGFAVDHASVDAGFFDAAGLRLLRGRNFGPSDAEDGEPVAIVNEAMAQRFWPDGDAVGRTFRRNERDVRVVGVAETAKVRSLGEAPQPFIYWPYTQEFSRSLWLVARTRDGVDPAAATATMLSTARSLAPDLLVLWTRTMEQHLAAVVMPARLGAIAISAFAALALLLAVLGVYGTVRYAVARRGREVGIRLSLGAEPAAVVRMLMGSGLRLVAIGVLVGLAVAAAVVRLLSSFLFGVRAVDPITFLAVPVLLLAVALGAAFLPARRAARIDPVVVLEAE